MKKKCILSLLKKKLCIPNSKNNKFVGFIQIKELKDKVQQMEHALTHVIQEFEKKRKIIGKVARTELEEVRKVVNDLSSKLGTKTMEMRHIKVYKTDSATGTTYTRPKNRTGIVLYGITSDGQE
jgi:exonuclease VII small subunit